MMALALSQEELPIEEPVPITEVITVTEEVKELVDIPQAPYEEDYATLYRICTCESSLGTGMPQQYESDGVTVLTGRVDPRDTGMCQINKYYHLETATKLGFDLDTSYGNWGYAKYLYDTQGVQPWRASQSCWNK